MSELYLRMTPGVAGYPYALKFGKSFSIYAKDFGEELHPVYSGRVRSAEHGTSFVRSSIENDSPVAVLILFHKAKELDDDTWHWITLFGHSGDTLIASNYGKKVLYRASVLFGRSFRNLVRMVSFRRSPQ